MTVDVSDPTSPILLGLTNPIPNFDAVDVQVVGNVAYIGSASAGRDRGAVLTIDVSDPASPSPLRFVRTVEGAVNLQVVEGVIYVANRYGGLYLFEYAPEPTSVTTLHIVIITPLFTVVLILITLGLSLHTNCMGWRFLMHVDRCRCTVNRASTG